MIQLSPLKLHRGQTQVYRERARFNCLACGRRFGKTTFGVDLIMEPALAGLPCGWFAPTYKLLADAWRECHSFLRPLGKNARYNRSDRRMDIATGGSIEFWSTEPAQAGDDESEVARGRKYQRIIYDEAARARRLKADWTKAIRATLADYRGDAWFLSTPKGHNYFHELWSRGQDDTQGDWASWQMPTVTNPHIHPDEVEAAKRDLPDDAFSQEYLAEFLADAANPFGITAIRACLDRDWRPIADAVTCWGVDVAKSVDHTVAVGLDKHGNCCAFQRWQSPWRDTMSRLAAMIGDTPAVVDSTGVGDPIVEMLQARCSQVEGFKFSRQSKQQIMEGLAVAIQRQAITFPPGVIQHELEIFEYEYTPTGVRYTAPEGAHDDCVDALALAVRCLNVAPPPVTLDGGSEPMTMAERAWGDPFLDDDESVWSQL